MIGKVIRQLRKDAGLTQKQLAKAIRSTQQNISNWEKDKVDQPRELLGIAKHFGLTLDQLYAKAGISVESGDEDAELRAEAFQLLQGLKGEQLRWQVEVIRLSKDRYREENESPP